MITLFFIYLITMRLFIIFIACILSHSSFAQNDIADARSYSEGAVVTVQGIVTNGSELGTIRYLQDASAGIAAFPGSGSVSGFGNVKIGDKIEVTGPLINFNGLLEISPIQSFEIISSNNTLPAPILTTLDLLGEVNESQLVKISNVVFTDAGDTFESNVSYEITADGESSSIYLRNSNPLVGTKIPTGIIELTAIASYFYEVQLLPRSKDDIEEQSTAFSFSEFPTQVDLETNSISVAWKTNFAAKHGINYGLSQSLGSKIEDNGSNKDISINIEGLSPNTFYYVQAFAEYQGNLITAPTQLMSTASTSTGETKIYFNHSVREEFSDGSSPDGTSPQSMLDAILNLIDNAKNSIDVCLYNIDQDIIVTALNDAVARGVKVRFIGNDGTSHDALGNANKSFDVLFVNPFSLMHNKFFVADAEDINNAWILTGSTNITNGNIYNDYNNMILVQDITLAKAYTIEFEEIWGSQTTQANSTNSLAGDDKVNNTPHLFKVDDILFESYFSPSDKTTAAIIKTLKTADDKVQFALLSFTKDEIAETLIDLHQQGIAVSGILENTNDQGSEFQNLNDNGVLVRKHDLQYQIHHKFALIDAFSPESDPTTITGSHNWSNGAETNNDENTLIIHDLSITNIYLQEYGQRSMDLGPKLATSNILNINVEISPNPSVSTWTLKFPKGHNLTKARLQHTNGQLIAEFDLQTEQNYFELNRPELMPGLYIIQLFNVQNNFIAKKLVKL